MMIVLFLLFPLVSCGEMGVYALLFGEDDVQDRFDGFPNFTNSALNSSISAAGLTKYTGIAISDIHFGSSKPRHEDDFLKWLSDYYDSVDEAKKPRFLMCLGDTANAGFQRELNDYNAFLLRVKDLAKEKLGLSSADDFPVYTILGNHDLYNNGVENWKSSVYPYTSTYFFDVGKFRFYALDTASGSLGSDQMSAFKKHMKSNSKPKIVLSHYSFYAGGILLFSIHDTYERNKIITYCAESNVKLILEGHQHEPQSFNWGKFNEYVVGSILDYGIFGLVTMDEADDSVSYQEIDL